MPDPAKRARDRRHDQKRRAEKPWRKWYSLPVWRRIRKAQLAKQPLCERHLKRGQVMPATTVNHVEPHRGDWDKFIAGPFESLCKTCHDSDVHGEELRGYSEEIGADGLPKDQRHPFYR